MQRDDVAGVDGGPQGFVHRFDVVVGEDLGLDVGNSPPGLAVLGFDRDCLAVGGDRIIGPTGRPEAVSVSDPVLGNV